MAQRRRKSAKQDDSGPLRPIVGKLTDLYKLRPFDVEVLVQGRGGEQVCTFMLVFVALNGEQEKRVPLYTRDNATVKRTKNPMTLIQTFLDLGNNEPPNIFVKRGTAK